MYIDILKIYIDIPKIHIDILFLSGERLLVNLLNVHLFCWDIRFVFGKILSSYSFANSKQSKQANKALSLLFTPSIFEQCKKKFHRKTPMPWWTPSSKKNTNLPNESKVVHEGNNEYVFVLSLKIATDNTDAQLVLTTNRKIYILIFIFFQLFSPTRCQFHDDLRAKRTIVAASQAEL